MIAVLTVRVMAMAMITIMVLVIELVLVLVLVLPVIAIVPRTVVFTDVTRPAVHQASEPQEGPARKPTLDLLLLHPSTGC